MSKLVYALSKDGKSYKMVGMKRIPEDEDILEIPEKHDGLPVVEIGKDAFENGLWTYEGKISKLHNIKKVILPDGLKIIGKYAFMDCIDLKEIVIPDSVTKIDKGAFINCCSLETIKFSKKMKEISDHTCCRCSSLKQVEIPDNIKIIGKWAFTGDSAMTGFPGGAEKFRAKSTVISIPASVIKIGKIAFANFTDLTINVYGHKNKPSEWDDDWCHDPYSNINIRGSVKVNWNC